MRGLSNAGRAVDRFLLISKPRVAGELRLARPAEDRLDDTTRIGKGIEKQRKSSWLVTGFASPIAYCSRAVPNETPFPERSAFFSRNPEPLSVLPKSNP